MQDLQLASEHPLLVPNAVEAVKQYVYKPTLPNGQPVEVITLVELRHSDARPAFENARM